MDDSEIRISKLEKLFTGQSNNLNKYANTDGNMTIGDREQIAIIIGSIYFAVMNRVRDAKQA